MALQFPSGARHFVSVQDYDEVAPVSKLLPFTAHASLPRRLGVAATIKNSCFVVSLHGALLALPIDLLPALIRPLMSGGDQYADEEMDALPEELQLLEPSVQREPDAAVLKTHLETLMMLTGTLKGRQAMREKGVYYVVRECHTAVEDEGVREACDRLVQVLMRDEDGQEAQDAATRESAARAEAGEGNSLRLTVEERGSEAETGARDEQRETGSDDEDDRVIEVF